MGMSLSSNGPPATCGQVLSFPLHQGRHSVLYMLSNESVNGNEGVSGVIKFKQAMDTVRGET